MRYHGVLAFSLQTCWSRVADPAFYLQVGRGVADPRILTSNVLAAVWPIPAFSLQTCWPRCGRSPHSHFKCVGRGVADPRILASNVLAVVWPIPAFSLQTCWPRVADPAFSLHYMRGCTRQCACRDWGLSQRGAINPHSYVCVSRLVIAT